LHILSYFFFFSIHRNKKPFSAQAHLSFFLSFFFLGRTFPVQDFFLEDVLELTCDQYTPPKAKGAAKASADDEAAAAAAAAGAGAGAGTDAALMQDAIAKLSSYPSAVQSSMTTMNETKTDYRLLVTLILALHERESARGNANGA
jgi:hypothetical protein